MKFFSHHRCLRRRCLLPGTLGALLLVLLGAAGCGGPERVDVVLQLNWYHEAEFVGYYMAYEKGFYEDEGLEISILEGGPGTPARDTVVDGRSTFAITSFAEQRQLIEEGQPVIAVMAAFQIPPLVIFSLAESGIDEPVDLVGRKVGITTDYWLSVLTETLIAAGIDPADVTTVRVEPHEMNKLYEGTVDAWLGYAQDEPIKAETSGYPVNTMFPSDFGIGGYEGLVIVRQNTIAADPSVAERFVRASHAGWRYAVEHSDEAAEALTEWAPENDIEFQKLAVRAVAPLVDTPQVPVGWIDSARWQQLMGDAWDAARPGFTMEFSPVRP